MKKLFTLFYLFCSVDLFAAADGHFTNSQASEFEFSMMSAPAGLNDSRAWGLEGAPIGPVNASIFSAVELSDGASEALSPVNVAFDKDLSGDDSSSVQSPISFSGSTRSMASNMSDAMATAGSGASSSPSIEEKAAEGLPWLWGPVAAAGELDESFGGFFPEFDVAPVAASSAVFDKDDSFHLEGVSAAPAASASASVQPQHAAFSRVSGRAIKPSEKVRAAMAASAGAAAEDVPAVVSGGKRKASKSAVAARDEEAASGQEHKRARKKETSGAGREFPSPEEVKRAIALYEARTAARK